MVNMAQHIMIVMNNDDYNLSFLYYYNTFWNKEWGGTLRFYDASQQGLNWQR